MSDDDILEKLSQEERLKLLERLIKGASQEKEENLTLEQRVKRLENMFSPGREPTVSAIRMSCGCCD